MAALGSLPGVHVVGGGVAALATPMAQSRVQCASNASPLAVPGVTADTPEALCHASSTVLNARS
jgi:hypothetical protein